jgi:hypothetical protein
MTSAVEPAARPERRDDPFGKGFLEFIRSIAADTRDHVKAVLAPRDERIAALEARIAALEERPTGVKWAGVYEPGSNYSSGDLVTRRGGLWVALKHTALVPGASGAWRLVVKSGPCVAAGVGRGEPGGPR